MAGIIKKEDIERVRHAADLYDVVSQTVTLKASGSGTYMGLCPFHDEKTPSFSVRPSLGVWHCFGCGAHGDIFDYIKKRDSIDFGEAVEVLADMYHIELHYESLHHHLERNNVSTRSRLLQANEEAQNFFMSCINTAEASPAQQLLAGRHFTQEQAQHFGCGYAPRGWNNLVNYLAKKGFTQKEMVDAGLARPTQNGVYDYFRGRLTWPIRDSAGRTLGFGARRLYDDDRITAKYINTPDTVLYKKAQVLYGLDLAKTSIVSKRQVVIVEGYTDVMACHIAGITTAVATCGTAFGHDHAKIVRRLIADDSLGAIQLVGPSRGSKIIFTFDGDAAGQKAAMRAFQFDGAFLTQTFVAVAPNNLDPCDLRITYGDQAIQKLLEQPKPLYDFVIDTVIARCDTQYTAGVVAAMKAVAPLIARIKDRSLVDAYTRKTAGTLGIPIETMRHEVQEAVQHNHVQLEDIYRSKKYLGHDYEDTSREVELYAQKELEREALIRANGRQQSYFRIEDTIFLREQQFMGALIQMPKAINTQLFRYLSPQSFYVPTFQLIFSAVLAVGGLPSATEPISPQDWVQKLNAVGGISLSKPIHELAVMPLPTLISNTKVGGSSSPARSASSFAATDKETRKYIDELMMGLYDSYLLRCISYQRRQLGEADNDNKKLQIVKEISQLEQQRELLKRNRN